MVRKCIFIAYISLNPFSFFIIKNAHIKYDNYAFSHKKPNIQKSSGYPAPHLIYSIPVPVYPPSAQPDNTGCDQNIPGSQGYLEGGKRAASSSVPHQQGGVRTPSGGRAPLLNPGSSRAQGGVLNQRSSSSRGSRAQGGGQKIHRFLNVGNAVGLEEFEAGKCQ